MKFVGIDLHKKSISLCVRDASGRIVTRRRFHTQDVDRISGFFGSLDEFAFCVEATSAYEWLVQLLEPMARQWVLVHPSRMRVIAESTSKSDKVDAEVLSDFLQLGKLPRAYRPTPREREHRTLARYRAKCRQRVTKLRCRIRHILANYNADRVNLFGVEGREHLSTVVVTKADRFVLDELLSEHDEAMARLAKAKQELRRFAATGDASEEQARAIATSVPGIGETIAEVVLAELADVERFGSIASAGSYAGLAPGRRGSADKVIELGITKQGSRLLRWAMVQAAWQAVRHSARWREVYERIKKRRGSKRAIVAVARKLLVVLASLLKSGQLYRRTEAEEKEVARRARLRRVKSSRREPAAKCV
jgi:transposase